MWRGVRWTHSRCAPNSRIFARARNARRLRARRFSMGLLLLRLFPNQLFFGVLDAFALVGLRRAEVADFRRRLADSRTVDAANDAFRLAARSVVDPSPHV